MARNRVSPMGKQDFHITPQEGDLWKNGFPTKGFRWTRLWKNLDKFQFTKSIKILELQYLPLLLGFCPPWLLTRL